VTAAAANGKSLGLVACTAVVVGNTVGSGFYLSPAAVAPYGLLAILMWMARVLWGSWGGDVISFAVILSSIGALNGWTLTMGQVPMAAAQFYTQVVNLATVAAVVPYAFCALALSLITVGGADAGKASRVTPVEWVAFLFAMFTIYGCGPEAALYGLILLVLGIPVYLWLRRGAGPLAKEG